jgi:hypothetical protein
MGYPKSFIHQQSLTNLNIYSLFEPERIGNIIVAVGRSARSNHNRTIPEDTSQNILRYLNTLAFCQYQFNRPTTDYSSFDNNTPVGDGIDGAYFHKHTLHKRHQSQEQ